MLDTNVVGALISGKAAYADAGLRRHPVGSVCLSVVTEAEILHGLANNPEATRKAALMRQVLSKFAILPWTSATAEVYGTLPASLRQAGRSLGPLDLLIAAHALQLGVPLATGDRAFRHVPGLSVEEWTG